MTDRKIEIKFEDFLNSDVEIILNNGFHYTGKVLSVGDTFLKLDSTRGEIAFIVIEMICSITRK